MKDTESQGVPQRSCANACSPSRVDRISTNQTLAKCCDRCGHGTVTVDGIVAEHVWCDACGMMGEIVHHGGHGETIEERIDIVWIDPCTGESWLC